MTKAKVRNGRSSAALELHARRQSAGLTQRQLADLAGISERSVRGLESDGLQTPRLATLEALAGALGLAGNDVEAFVGQWRVDTIRQELPPHADYSDVSERLLGISRANASKVLATHDEVAVSESGTRTVTTQRRLLRSTSLPASYYWTARRRRPGELDLAVRHVVGGRLTRHASDGTFDAFLITLAEPASKGRPVLVGLEFEIERDAAAGPPSLYTLVFVDVPESVAIVGRFAGRPPVAARTLLGRTTTRPPARGRRLPIDETGAFTLALTRPAHPVVGVAWDWTSTTAEESG